MPELWWAHDVHRSLTSNNCPYCLTPIQRDERHDAPDRLPVDGVVPFTVDRKQAQDLIGTWINSVVRAERVQVVRPATGSSRRVRGLLHVRRRDPDSYRASAATTTRSARATTAARDALAPRQRAGRQHFDDVRCRQHGHGHQAIAKLEPWPTATAKAYSRSTWPVTCAARTTATSRSASTTPPRR